MASRADTHATKRSRSPRRGCRSCPYQSDPQCPPLPTGGYRRKCPFNDETFLRRIELWLDVPVNATEDELIWRCDVSAGVIQPELIASHYSRGYVNREICYEFCRAHDEYKRRMIDYQTKGDDGGCGGTTESVSEAGSRTGLYGT
jgi:hypothetical protein